MALQQSLIPLPNPRTFLTSLIDEIASIPHPLSSATFKDANVRSALSNPLSSLEGKGKTCLLTLHVLLPNETLPALDLLERGCVQRFVAKPRSGNSEPGPAIATPARTITERPENQLTTPAATQSKVSQQEKHVFTYYVQSASSHHHQRYQAGSSRFVSHEPARYYEVRLQAWNCSCPAFAFSAFPAGLLNEVSEASLREREEKEEEEAGGNAVVQRDMEGEGEGEGDNEGVVEDKMVLDIEQESKRGTTATNVLESAESAQSAWGFGGLHRGEHAAVCKHLLACLLGDRCPLFQDFVEEKEVSVEEAAGWAAGWGA